MTASLPARSATGGPTAARRPSGEAAARARRTASTLLFVARPQGVALRRAVVRRRVLRGDVSSAGSGRGLPLPMERRPLLHETQLHLQIPSRSLHLLLVSSSPSLRRRPLSDSFVSSRWQSAARRRNAGPRLLTGARVSEKKEQTRLVSQGTTQHTVCVCRDHTGWESRDLDGNFRYTRARNSLMPIPVIGRTQIWGWWQG